MLCISDCLRACKLSEASARLWLIKKYKIDFPFLFFPSMAHKKAEKENQWRRNLNQLCFATANEIIINFPVQFDQR